VEFGRDAQLFYFLAMGRNYCMVALLQTCGGWECDGGGYEYTITC